MARRRAFVQLILRIIHTIDEMRASSRSVRAESRTIGFVPTMGALHAGHIALMEHARHECDHVVASIFVNPTQFDRLDDLEKYPRTLDADVEACSQAGVDVVFAPSANEMYPAGPRTNIRASSVGSILEGASRPGHFDGVATVVALLFSAVEPDVAYFGRKDYQQTLVVRDVARDHAPDVRIDVRPTVRDADGLALSSRNVRLSADDRVRALAIPRGLDLAQRLFVDGTIDADSISSRVRETLTDQGLEVDYVHVGRPSDLSAVATCEAGDVILIAARVGDVRLIDNAILDR
ncbi:MAG: pantoate--beta-alanine ligase [Actinomycetota bacterium]